MPHIVATVERSSSFSILQTWLTPQPRYKMGSTMNMQILGVTLRRVTSRSLEGDFHHNEKLRREIWVNNGQYMISIDILDTIPYIYFLTGQHVLSSSLRDSLVLVASHPRFTVLKWEACNFLRQDPVATLSSHSHAIG